MFDPIAFDTKAFNTEEPVVEIIEPHPMLPDMFQSGFDEF